jgi:Ca2+-binding RTX toxin-like protein
MALIKGTNSGDTLNWLDGISDSPDIIYGYGGNDTINAMGGDDTIHGGAGADTIDGGWGSDTVVYTDSDEGVYVDLTIGKGYEGTAQGDTLKNVENVTGSWYDDLLIGNGANNRLSGGDGIDVLRGGGGADTLIGGNGDDVLKGGSGGDQLHGGDGIDTLDYSDSNIGVDVLMYFGTAEDGYAQGDVYSGIENVTGSGYDDQLGGDGGDNVLRGLGGHDGLVGSDGNDQLYGDDGNDILVGGHGGDLMVGGSGADTFVYTDMEHSGIAISDTDVLGEFKLAQGDKIDVSEIDANMDLAGNQDFTFIGPADYSGAGQIRVVTDGADTYLAFNTDSASDNDGAIRIIGLHNVDASWFVL